MQVAYLLQQSTTPDLPSYTAWSSSRPAATAGDGAGAGLPGAGAAAIGPKAAVQLQAMPSRLLQACTQTIRCSRSSAGLCRSHRWPAALPLPTAWWRRPWQSLPRPPALRLPAAGGLRALTARGQATAKAAVRRPAEGACPTRQAAAAQAVPAPAVAMAVARGGVGTGQGSPVSPQKALQASALPAPRGLPLKHPRGRSLPAGPRLAAATGPSSARW